MAQTEKRSSTVASCLLMKVAKYISLNSHSKSESLDLLMNDVLLTKEIFRSMVELRKNKVECSPEKISQKHSTYIQITAHLGEI